MSEAYLYHLVNGMILYSEDVLSSDTEYFFDPARTVTMQVIRQTGPQVQLATARMTEGIGKPKDIRVFKSAVVMISQITDEALITGFKATLAGIVMPQGGNNPHN